MALLVPRNVCAKMVASVITLMGHAHVPRAGKDFSVTKVSGFKFDIIRGTCISVISNCISNCMIMNYVNLEYNKARSLVLVAER